MLDANEKEGAVQVVETWNCLKMEGTSLIALRKWDFIWNYPFDFSPSDTYKYTEVTHAQWFSYRFKIGREVGSFTAAQIASAEKVI